MVQPRVSIINNSFNDQLAHGAHGHRDFYLLTTNYINTLQFFLASNLYKKLWYNLFCSDMHMIFY